MIQNNIVRSFPLGSEWLYFKIYTSEKNAEEMLLLDIKELIDLLLEDELIVSWFFIRYNDDDFHIRLRFKVKNSSLRGEVWEKCCSVLNKLMYKGVVWNIMMDTYNREIERYKLEFIEFSEALFFKDSEMIINSLSIVNNSSNSKLRVLLGLSIIDHYFTIFNIDYSERLKVIDLYKKYYKSEMVYDKDIFKQLNKKYNLYRGEIERMFLDDSKTNNNEINLLRNKLFSISSDKIDILKANDDFQDILGSYIHMSINRLFITKNRENEYVLYEFMYLYYKSLIKRNTNTKMKLE